MIAFPTAKINIGLQIVAKRPDGFHNLLSAFYPIGWSDVLEILPAPELRFTASGLPIPGDEADNLCLQAYRLLLQDFPIAPVHIHLHKVIPIGAGLGGGSSDGAYTLQLLNQLFSLSLNNEQLEHYARQLGSDCAFFIRNQPVFSFEKGDQFEPLEMSLKDLCIVLVNPQVHISTKEAYAGIVPQAPATDLKTALLAPISTWKGEIRNDFEAPLAERYPVIAYIKNELYQQGALYASMTGSGSTVYGIFDQDAKVKPSFPHCIVWQGKLG